MTHPVMQTKIVTSSPLKTGWQIDRRAIATTISLSIVTALSALSAISLLPHTAIPALAQSSPTLVLGSTGETVSQLQATLKLLGFYTGEVNGTYDPPTANAVTQFQTAAGIIADGVAGPSTWQKLLPAPDSVSAASQPASTATPVTARQSTSPAAATAPVQSQEVQPQQSFGPPVLRAEAEGSAVAQLQRELQTLGYYDGAIDGGFGEQTQLAVEQFQSDQQLFVDGVVGAATWDALARALDSL